MVKLSDVARVAGVSIATASLVLSDKSQGRVSEATAERVREAAQELGYVRNALAAGMRNQRSRTIGVVAEQALSTPYAVDMVAGIMQEAHARDWSVLMTDAAGDGQASERAVRQMRSQRVKAIIYAPMYHKSVHVTPELDNIYVLNGFADRPGIPGIVPDEERAAFEATTHLLELGHRRIAHITVPSGAVAVDLRISGYRKALHMYGLGPAEEILIYGRNNDPAGCDEAAEAMLARAEVPTAVFCYNDALAAGVYRRATRHGLRVPENLSVVGFDDLRLISTNLDPPLTTMRLPHCEMATWLTRRVIDPQVYESPPTLTRARCPLVVRASTAPPP